MDEITNKRQLRRLVVLPYDLIIKEVFPENIRIVTEFAKKTGDYPSLSATDIKVMALTYQLEKKKVGVNHLRTEPVVQKSVNVITKPPNDIHADITGFFLPTETSKSEEEKEVTIKEENNFDATELDKELEEKFGALDCNLNDNQADGSELEECDSKTDILVTAKSESDENSEETDDDDDDSGWITPSNVKLAKKQVNSKLIEEKQVTVACITTDFAMQNVLKQMNLNVAALDGRVIKQLRTYILRCYACFKTTSIMSKQFCPKCGHNTLKKVAVSLDEDGKMQIHINARKPLTARGKRFSLPKIKGGKHPNNPILVADQPMADNQPSRLAKTKTNPLDDDYIAGK